MDGNKSEHLQVQLDQGSSQPPNSSTYDYNIFQSQQQLNANEGAKNNITFDSRTKRTS